MRWIRLSGLVALALIIVASLMLPAKLQQLRTGHWAAEHFLAYFAATLFVCLGWRRPRAKQALVVVTLVLAVTMLMPSAGIAQDARVTKSMTALKDQTAKLGSPAGRFSSLDLFQVP